MTTWDEFKLAYQPLAFKWLYHTTIERLPKETHFDFLHIEKIHIKKLLNLPIMYRDVRHSLTPEGKKTADMLFLTYFTKERDRDVQNAPRVSKWYYWYLSFYYFAELQYINKHISSKETDNYILRWGYLLDVDQSFVELIHGTDGDTALYAIKNIP